MAISPTQRSLAHARKKLGWAVDVVEHWNSHTRQRRDLFHIIDIVALGANKTIGIQATSTGNAMARVDKLINSESTLQWLADPNRELEVWGWAKQGARGKRKLWTLKRINLRDHVMPELIEEARQNMLIFDSTDEDPDA